MPCSPRSATHTAACVPSPGVPTSTRPSSITTSPTRPHSSRRRWTCRWTRCRIKDAATSEGFSGERLIERFLAQWEQGGGPGSPTFVSLAQAMTASQDVADNVREFVAERIGLHGAPGDDETTMLRRRSLVSSQLLGIAWNRYVMRMEPMASASRAEVARWAGPTIDHYALGRADPIRGLI